MSQPPTPGGQPAPIAVYDDDLLYDGHDGIFLRDGEPFTGIARRVTRNNAVIAEDHFENGRQNGVSRYWYPSGEPRGEEHFRHDSLHGSSTEWYPSGRIKRRSTFELGILVNEQQWDEAGNLSKTFELKEGDRAYRSLLRSRKIDAAK